MEREEYFKKIREAGRELYEKMTARSQFQELMNESALQLGLDCFQDKLVIRDEVELYSLFDFTINEYRKDNVTFLEEFMKTYEAENRQEELVLEALLLSKTRLLKFSSFSSEKYTLLLQDLLEPNRKIPLMDQTLSRTVTRVANSIFFLRCLSFKGFNVGSGFVLVFPGKWERYLVKKWSYFDKIESQELRSMKRFAAFYKLFVEIGHHEIFFQ